MMTGLGASATGGTDLSVSAKAHGKTAKSGAHAAQTARGGNAHAAFADQLQNFKNALASLKDAATGHNGAGGDAAAELLAGDCENLALTAELPTATPEEGRADALLSLLEQDPAALTEAMAKGDARENLLSDAAGERLLRSRLAEKAALKMQAAKADAGAEQTAAALPDNAAPEAALHSHGRARSANARPLSSEPIAAETASDRGRDAHELQGTGAASAAFGQHVARDHRSDDATAEGEGGSGSETDRIVRFTRADRKGGTLDMPTDGKTEARLDEAGNRPARLEMATVLDSRRYLAPAATGGNAAMIAQTLGGDPEWAAAMRSEALLQNQANLASTGNVVNTLKIQLNPVDLGKVTATLRLTGEHLSIEISVENRAAFHHLKDDQSSIIDSLKDQGFSVDQMNVVFNSSAADQTDSQRNQGGGSQPSFDRGSSAGDARQQAGQGRNAAGEHNSRQGGAHGGRSDQGADRGTAASVAGAGSLYL